MMNARIFWREMSAFEAFNKSKGLSPKTIRLYNHALRHFVQWFIDEYGEDAEITARRVRGFIAHRLEKGNSRATIRSYIGTIRTFFSFLEMDEVIDESQNPMRLVKTPRVPKRQIEPLTSEQTHRLLDSFDKDRPAQYRDYVICCVILDTGLRIGEMARLTVDDVDFDSSCLKVNGKGAKPRTAYVGRKMRKMLLDYVENHRPEISNGHPTLFPPSNHSPHLMLQIEYLSAIIREKMDEAGIPRARSSGHRLRHTFAVNFLRGGGGVFHLQRLLGHSSLTMTKRYVMLAEEDLAEAHRKASPVDRMIL